MTSLAPGHWVSFQYQAGVSSCGVVFKSNRRAGGDGQVMSATSVSLGSVCRAQTHCGLEESQLGRTISCFLPWEDLIAPFNVMRARPKGGGLQVRSSMALHGPVSEGHGVFSSRHLDLTLGRQPRAAASLYCLWGSLGLPQPTPL